MSVGKVLTYSGLLLVVLAKSVQCRLSHEVNDCKGQIMNSALVMAHSPGIGAAVLIPPGVYLCLWAAGLPSGAGFVLALSNMLVLTPLTSLLLPGWFLALYSSQTQLS